MFGMEASKRFFRVARSQSAVSITLEETAQ
jgi:hypothetical protein